MRAQQLGHPVRAELGAAEHRVEERRHRVRIEPGGGQDADADAIGLVFIFAGEIDAGLRGHVLGRGDRTHRHV